MQCRGSGRGAGVHRRPLLHKAIGTDRGGQSSMGVLRPASSNYFYCSRRSFGEESHMNWFYWNTAWSLFFSLVWFMTITHNPDARISDAHLRDEAFGG
jgi:hypothetical protein